MAASEGLVSLSFVVGLAFAGVALRAVGPQGVYAIGGFTGAIGALVLLPALRRARASEPAVDASAVDGSASHAPAEPETVVPAG